MTAQTIGTLADVQEELHALWARLLEVDSATALGVMMAINVVAAVMAKTAAASALKEKSHGCR